MCAVAAALPPGALTAAAFLSGLLCGWVGVAAAAVGGLVAGAVFPHAAGVPSVFAVGASSALGAAAAAALPFVVFRQIPSLGRGLPNLRSYAWLLACASLAPVLRSVVGWTLGGGGPLLAPWAHAFAGSVAVVATAPLVVVVCDLEARRWMAPIRGETPARRSLAVGEVARLSPKGAGSTTRVLTIPRRPFGRLYFLGLVAIVVVTLLVVPLLAVLPTGGQWTLLLYLAPILWTASTYGMRGAVTASSASLLAFVLGRAAWGAFFPAAGPAVAEAAVLGGSELAWRSACAQLVLFGLVGAYAGTASEREQVLRSEVIHRNHLLRHDLLRVVQALTNAVEAKDVYTEGHLRRVSEYAVRVAESLFVHGAALEMVFFASMLHDIGKIAVPEAILTKKGPLTPEETRIMQKHAEVGARILQNLDVLRDAAPLVLHHQERWDGRRDGPYPGYPAGLSGESIPLGSRIIAVVDAFDAMTTDRPYRKAMAVETAIAELRNEAGRQFDPGVVDVFVAQLEAHPWKAEVA